jgi:hypothetical protein
MPVSVKTIDPPEPPEEPKIRGEDVKVALERVGLTTKCPSCGSEEPKRTAGGFQLIDNLTYPALPLVLISCQQCGHVRIFDNTVLKVHPR